MTKKILPFRACHYNLDKISSLQDVVAPPYDVISKELQSHLYEKNPYNFCRLDLTKEEGPKRYDIAKKTFHSWLQEKILIQDKVPAIYLHFHTFSLPNGESITRKSFFAARLLENFEKGLIKPHEKTLEAPKQDRLAMTHATEAQLSPIFTLYSDPEQKISNAIGDLPSTTPFFDFKDENHDRHELWKIQDPKICDVIDEFLSQSPLFIADGHHRYETALNYRNEILKNYPNLPENAAPRYVMMCFSNLNDEGLVILPIHRALHGLQQFSLLDFLHQLSENFEVQEIAWQNQDQMIENLKKEGLEKHCFSLLAKNKSAYLLSLARDKWLRMSAAQSLPETLRGLDVSVLHRYVFQELLELSEEAQVKQQNIIYWKSTDKAIEETQKKSCDVTFLLNPTKIEDVQRIALAGQKLPQKSTYFYPKILSGLLIHSVKISETVG